MTSIPISLGLSSCRPRCVFPWNVPVTGRKAAAEARSAETPRMFSPVNLKSKPLSDRRRRSLGCSRSRTGLLMLGS